MAGASEPKWKFSGVRVVHASELVPHQEIIASDEAPLSCVLVRSGQEPVVVNLDIPVVEKPEEVHWVDNIHPAPKN